MHNLGSQQPRALVAALESEIRPDCSSPSHWQERCGKSLAWVQLEPSGGQCTWKSRGEIKGWAHFFLLGHWAPVSCNWQRDGRCHVGYTNSWASLCPCAQQPAKRKCMSLANWQGAGHSWLGKPCVLGWDWKHCGCKGGHKVWLSLLAVIVNSSICSGLPDCLMRVIAALSVFTLRTAQILCVVFVASADKYYTHCGHHPLIGLLEGEDMCMRLYQRSWSNPPLWQKEKEREREIYHIQSGCHPGYSPHPGVLNRAPRPHPAHTSGYLLKEQTLYLTTEAKSKVKSITGEKYPTSVFTNA